MHLETLKCFVCVVEERSISKAAQKIHISQSAASQMLQKLEEDFGHELLVRSNKGVTLTPRGEIALKHIQKMMKSYDAMVAEMQTYDANDNKINISGTSSLSSYSLPCMIYRIKKRFSEVEYRLTAKSLAEIVTEVRDGEVDFGFIDEVLPVDTGLTFHKLGYEKVVLVAKSDYGVGAQIDLKTLLGMELIMCTMNSKIVEQLDAALKTIGKTSAQLNVIFNVDSMTAVMSSVLNGYGMAFVPYESVKRELYEQSIKLIEVEGLNMNYDIYMVCRSQNLLSPSAQKTRDYLLEVGQKSFC